MFRAVAGQARRVAEAFVCAACSPDGTRCVHPVGHDAGEAPTAHRGEGPGAPEWV